ncbi:hypothetical protein GW17_00027414 [Ensete ventricosum]|uniref:Uncharacterized protein n=1 Tax=Ensete ventricosum TaxID=4639 RepID=A0A426XS94_ENSVE|nr:hypothetical protein B296_00041556 [Ensete ventricosum]RWW09114.1 hypothetical protein GW17_00027414 [Ensete ventricosum]
MQKHRRRQEKAKKRPSLPRELMPKPWQLQSHSTFPKRQGRTKSSPPSRKLPLRPLLPKLSSAIKTQHPPVLLAQMEARIPQPPHHQSYIMASEISDCVFDHEDLPAAAGLQHDKLQDYFDNSLVIERALRKAFNVSSDEGDSSPPDAYMSLAEFVGLDQARGAVEKDVTKDNSCVPDERSRSPTQEHAPQQSGLLRRSSSVLSAKT